MGEGGGDIFLKQVVVSFWQGYLYRLVRLGFYGFYSLCRSRATVEKRKKNLLKKMQVS